MPAPKTEITDTEQVAPRIRRITLGDHVYRIPPTPPISYFMWMRNFLKRFQDGDLTDDDIVDCYEQTVGLLRRYNRTVDEQALQDSVELADLITFYNRCFGANADPGEPDEEEMPARPRGTGGASRKPAKSRSSI